MILPEQTGPRGLGLGLWATSPPENLTVPSWLFRAGMGPWCGSGQGWKPGSWTAKGRHSHLPGAKQGSSWATDTYTDQ